MNCPDCGKDMDRMYWNDKCDMMVCTNGLCPLYHNGVPVKPLLLISDDDVIFTHFPELYHLYGTRIIDAGISSDSLRVQ